MVTASLSVFTQAAIGVSSVVLPVLGAYVSNKILGYLKISSTSAAAQHVQAGVTALADLAVDAVTSAAARNQTIQVSDAVGNVMNQVSAQLMLAATAAGTTPENLVARVTSLVTTKLAMLPPPATTPTK